MDADVLSRRCVLMRLLDFSYERYQRALRQSAGAVVIILPRAMAAVPQDVVRVSPSPPRQPSSVQARPWLPALQGRPWVPLSWPEAT